MGRSFLARPADSIEAREIVERLKGRIGNGELREYVFDDYLLLYAVIGDFIYLLAIRHHKQLSFDFGAFWTQ